jgi:hypothetical protein
MNKFIERLKLYMNKHDTGCISNYFKNVAEPTRDL